MSNTHIEGLKVKHTAGPWRIGRDHFKNPIVLESKRNTQVASVMFASRIGEEEANAILIASAPDLLERLKYVYELYGGGWGEPAQESVKALITKAEGRA